MATIIEVLDLLRKQGVEIKAETEATVKTKFEGMLLAPKDKVLSDGEIAISAEFNESKSRDILTAKDELRKIKRERDELKALVEGVSEGEGDARTKLEKITAENKRLKNLAEAHLSEKKQLWKTMADKIPESMREFFKKPDEGKDLNDDEILANVAKLEEYQRIGAFKIDGVEPAPSHSRVAPAGGDKKIDTAAWQKLPPTQKIAYGHEIDAAKKSGG